MHEDFRRDETIRGSSERSFGIVMAIFFALVGSLPLLQRSPEYPRLWALAVAAVSLALALLRPALLRPLNRLWQRFGLLLHKIATPVVLGLLFYATVTPVALIAGRRHRHRLRDRPR